MLVHIRKPVCSGDSSCYSRLSNFVFLFITSLCKDLLLSHLWLRLCVVKIRDICPSHRAFIQVASPSGCLFYWGRGPTLNPVPRDRSSKTAESWKTNSRFWFEQPALLSLQDPHERLFFFSVEKLTFLNASFIWNPICNCELHVQKLHVASLNGNLPHMLGPVDC